MQKVPNHKLKYCYPVVHQVRKLFKCYFFSGAAVRIEKLKTNA